MPDADGSRSFVQSLARGLAVLRAFDADHPELTLPEIAQRADVSRAAARRFALTLAELGYMASDDGRVFRLTPAVLQLGYAFLASQPEAKLLQARVAELAREVGEHTAACVLDGDDVRYVASVRSDRLVSLELQVGSRLPAYVTAMGRVLLGELPDAELDAYLRRARLERLTEVTTTDPDLVREAVRRARADGYAVIVQELDPGLKALAMPARRPDGSVAAALNISMRTGIGRSREQERDELLTYLPALRACAAAVEADLAAAGR